MLLNFYQNTDLVALDDQALSELISDKSLAVLKKKVQLEQEKDLLKYN